MGAETEQLQLPPGAQPHMSSKLAPPTDHKKAEAIEKALKEKFWKEWNGKAGVEGVEGDGGRVGVNEGKGKDALPPKASAPPKAGVNKEKDVPPEARAKAGAEKQEDFAAFAGVCWAGV